MELWIRSQDKEVLQKITSLFVNDDGYIFSYDYINSNEVFLGKYKTKERALEVLDEIQDILKPKLIIKNEGRDYVGLDGVVYRTNLVTNTNTDIQQLSTYVYEMPIE